jgi:hypothetical protein
MNKKSIKMERKKPDERDIKEDDLSESSEDEDE